MDKQTLQYYKENAVEVFLRYKNVQNGISKYFTLSFPPHIKILDIGSGSGRDILKLLKLGYDAYGIEPCDKLRMLTIKNYPELSGRIKEGGLPDFENPFDGQFDGILCSAVIMHIPREHLFNSLFSIRNILRGNGRLLLSIPFSRPNLDNKQRDEYGRLFIMYKPDYLQLVLERIGFQLIGKWENDDSLGRAGYSWITMLFQLETSQFVRPVDQIEGILTRDKKTATYKLALIRALCDIAMKNSQIAKWEGNEIVGIPINTVVEKWICYYWPIIESSKFIPQIRGESETSKTKIAFRYHLNKLINYYKQSGGLTRFTLDYRGFTINEDIKEILSDVFKIIRKTIVKEPVEFAGGSFESGKVFK